MLDLQNPVSTSYTVKEGTKSIAGSVFSNAGQLTQIQLPDSLVSIGNNAFYGCSVLPEITLPENLRFIGDSAFTLCTALTDITLPDSLTYIGTGAFSNCVALTSVEIPENVSEIGMAAFATCTSLTEIQVSPLNQYFCDEDGVLYDAGKTKLYQYPTAKTGSTYVVPQGVTEIDVYAFAGNPALTYVDAGNGVTSIGIYAFAGCTALETVTLSDGLEQIAGAAFSHCSSLQSLVLPEGVTTIGMSAFEECSSLTEITIPASVTLIDPTAFSLSDNVVVYGVVNSYTEFFSSSAGLQFQPARSEFLSDYVQYDETEGYAFGFTPGVPLADVFTVTYGGILTLTPNEAGFENGTGALMQMKNSGGQLLSEYTVLIFGDVNGDSAIDAFDAALLQLQLGNAAELTGAYAKAGDLNGDGALSAADYAQVHGQLEGSADISQTPAF